MRVPISWLKEYVRFSLTSDKLAEILLLAGTKVEEIIKKGDETILDLEITPNRPDTLSILGVAREVSAITEKELLEPVVKDLPKPQENLPFNLKIQNPKLSSHYSLVLISKVVVSTSPSWMKERLENAGVRPINNIVDVTNYVMLEMGQPMHAFDYDKISGHKMLMRQSKKGERVITLDGIERTLPEGSIIIEDEEKIIDLVGIMGGDNSKVDQNTQNILLFVDVCDPVLIRKTSLFLGLRTEASSRYEKKIDQTLHPLALERTGNLILETSGGEIASKIVSVDASTSQKVAIDLDLNLASEFLGVELDNGEASDILTRLGFQIKAKAGELNILEVTAPTFRRDISIVEDLYEEIGRIYGYNNLPRKLPTGQIPEVEESALFNLEFEIKEILQGLGFTECYLATLTNQKILKATLADEKTTLKLSNPMSEEFEYLRPHLLGGLLTAAELNLREYPDISLFELGRVFRTEMKDKLPRQPKKLTLITTKNFYELKGVLELLLKELGIDNFKLGEEPFKVLEAGGRISVKNTSLGKIGTVKKTVTQAFEIKKAIQMLNLDLESLAKLTTKERTYKPLPKFPYVEEDFSISISKDTKIETILSAFKIDPKINKVEVFDLFTDKSLGENKSVGVRVRYRAKDHTLSPEEISTLREKITRELASIKAKIR